MSSFREMLLNMKSGFNPDIEIVLDEQDVANIEAADVAMGYKAPEPKMHYVPRNAKDSDIRTKGVETYSVKYMLNPEQFSKLKETAQHKFLLYEPTKPHDHPLSHIYTDMNEEMVIRSFAGEKFIDLFGNETRNAKWKTNCISYQGMLSSKDYLRALHRTDKVLTFEGYLNTALKHPEVKKYLMVHTLYYADIEQLAQILFSGPRVTIDAIVHRHSKRVGSINGECDYVVDDKGIVTQTTPLNESYRHKTVEPYFKQYEAQTSQGVIVWTASKLLGDSYRLTFTACPGFKPDYKIPRLVLPSAEDDNVNTIIKTGTNFEIRSCFGYTWLTSIDNRDVELNDIEFYTELRRYVNLQDRNMVKIKDLIHYAKRLTDSKDLFAKHADSYYNIPPELMAWYVMAAYYEDLSNENDAMLTMRRAHKHELRLHTELRGDITAREETICGNIQESAAAIKKTVVGATRTVGDMMDRSGVGEALKDIALGSSHHPVLNLPSIARKSIAELKLQEINAHFDFESVPYRKLPI